MIIILYPKGGKTRMKRIKRKDDEGAMGVGTLIIFIAMVLVAAVAASVLIDTANQLQSQAQRTGREAIQEVSSAFRVVDMYGEDTEEDGAIDQVHLKVTLAAGANPQDLNKTTIQWMTEDSEENSDAQDLVTEFIRGTEDGVIEPGDLVKFTITELNLEAQDTLNVRIIPKHGTPTYVGIKAPAVVSDSFIDL